MLKRGLIINDYGAIIREEPDKKAKVLGTLDVFDTVDIIEEGHDWKKIQVLAAKGFMSEHVEGYIPSKFVTATGR